MELKSELNTPVIDTMQTKAAPKKFVSYIHNFRGIAILYVVAGHVLIDWPEGSIASRVLDMFWQNATTLFLFIAGYLFQHLSYKFDYKDYLTKKLQNVICPYLIISVPLLIYRIYYPDIPGFTTDVHPDFGTWPKWEQAGYYLLHGAHLQPLWFVPMISLFYLIAPILVYIDRHPKLYYSIIPLFIVSLIVQRSILSDTFGMAAHFLSVYVLGMFLSRYKDEYLEFAKKYWIYVTVLPIIFLVLTFFAPKELYDNFNFTHKLMFCGFYIYWLWRLEKYVPKWIGTLASLSFGIFFIHYFFILAARALFHKILERDVPASMLAWISIYVFVMVFTVISLKLAQKILGKKSKYFVGV